MEALTTSAFALPQRLAAKADPSLIAADERWFAALARGLDATVADLTARLAAVRRTPGRSGQHALERDAEIHRLTGRLRALRRHGIDLCLGHVVAADDPTPVYIGRLGLHDDEGRQLLVDWRSPAAEPFFGATHGDPMGLVRRRRYRWTGGRIVDYWDEVFTADGLEGRAALDDQSAFIASLGASRSPRMRDVLGTIAADQDAVIRAGSAGALVVDGGPGTGKTVVALHRAAYLLYADPRLGRHRGGVLVVGPHQPYLDYVSDVLPSLGEDGVQLCTLRDLVPEGATVAPDDDPEVAALKASTRMVDAVEAAVRFHEQPPRETLTVATDWAEVEFDADDWAEAFDAVEPGTPHNEARTVVWDAVLTTLTDRHLEDDEELPAEAVRAALGRHRELRAAVERAWPLLDAGDLIGDLWSVPAYLRHCAPSLAPDQVRTLQRSDPHAWTVSDLPLLDAARHRLGDADSERRARRREATLAARRREMAEVIADLVAADDSELLIMSMLKGDDLRNALDDDSGVAEPDPDALAGPFAHVVVDEAQELTDAEWQMVLRRCPSRSLTVVGDRAQARHGFTETWAERLARVGLDRTALATLRINYRTPEQVMAAAAPVIRAVLPDANVPTSIRHGEEPAVVRGRLADLDAIVVDWLATHDEGTACVIGRRPYRAPARVLSLTPELAKGLEFDLVVLTDPDGWGGGVEGAVDRYVAMTRATGRLVVLDA